MLSKKYMPITNYFVDLIAILASTFFLMAGVYNLLTSSTKRVALHDRKLPAHIYFLAKILRTSRLRASVNFGSKMPFAFEESDYRTVQNLGGVPSLVFSAILPAVEATMISVSSAAPINARLNIGASVGGGVGLRLTNSAPQTTYSRGYIYDEAAIC